MSVSKFIAKGILQAIVFIVVFVIIGYVLSIFFTKPAILHDILRWGFLTISSLIVWRVRGHWVWLVLAILSLWAYWPYIF